MGTRRRLRAAVIGTGFVGPFHVDAVRRGGYADVVAIGGSDEARTQGRAATLGVARGTSDIESILNDESIDVIHVCTPNRTHVELATAVLESGKHLVLEKPVALDSIAAGGLAELARKRGRHATAALTYRGYPMVQRARALVRAGDVGDVRLVHGGYIQDWLSAATDYNWRVDLEIGVAVPASNPSAFKASDAASLGVRVRVETRPIDALTVAQIGAALEAMRPALAKYSYGFYFDPESGLVVIQSEAPEASFSAIARDFPGKTAYRPGHFENTADWTNDTAPHWGGAYLQSSTKNCTSGFSLALQGGVGTKYMVTAGHCFANGTSTNMGTAYRESQAYPYWDFELIGDHTYGGYIYVDSSTGWPVKNATNPGIGNQYCTTGRSIGFRCNWTLRSLNVTICYTQDYPSGACAHNLAGFNAPNQVVQLGDSGGPLWYRYGSEYKAGVRGVVSGRFWDIYTMNWMSYATQYKSIEAWYVANAVIP